VVREIGLCFLWLYLRGFDRSSGKEILTNGDKNGEWPIIRF